MILLCNSFPSSTGKIDPKRPNIEQNVYILETLAYHLIVTKIDSRNWNLHISSKFEGQLSWRVTMGDRQKGVSIKSSKVLILIDILLLNRIKTFLCWLV